MTNLNFEIANDDLKLLFLYTKDAYKNKSFDNWLIEVKNSYKDYYNRNLNNLQKYGNPKTFSQWVNGQIISLTMY